MLFEEVTKQADREGLKCYLESSKNVPNVQIYERMGFEMSREMECRDGEDVCMVCTFPSCSRGFLFYLLFSSSGVLTDCLGAALLHGAESEDTGVTVVSTFYGCTSRILARRFALCGIATAFGVSPLSAN